MTETERLLEKIARAWADQEPVDWLATERSGGLTASQIEQLRALDEVTQALRRVQRDADTDAPRASPLFRWGPLEVQTRLNEGAQADIYRAYDPVLAQPVALKLLRGQATHAQSLTQQLQEVRGLAKVRHRNVLSIYGAAEHDGRFGIWTELVEGITLEQQLAGDGPVPIDDALVLGRDLLVRTMDGGRIAIQIGLVATAIALVIGVAWGAIAGYAGGVVDEVMMRVVDVLYAQPATVFVIVVMAVVQSKDQLLLFAFEAVVIGGLGSLWGTLAGGILLGVVQQLAAQANAADQIIAGQLAFLVILVVLPQGLTGRRRIA